MLIWDLLEPYSMMTKTRPFQIESAPGKEWFHAILDGDPSALKAYYHTRLDWCGGYPLVHDFLVTYGAFSDLPPLELSICEKLLPAAFEIAITAPDELFHAGLFFLGCVMPDDGFVDGPENFSEAMTLLQSRVSQLQFLPNLSCAWDTVVERSKLLRPHSGDSWSKDDIHRIKQLHHNEIALPNLDHEKQCDCPIPFKEVARMAQHSAVVGVRMRYRGQAVFRDAAYWVWQCDVRQKDWVWVPYIYVRQDASSQSR